MSQPQAAELLLGIYRIPKLKLETSSLTSYEYAPLGEQYHVLETFSGRLVPKRFSQPFCVVSKKAAGS